MFGVMDSNTFDAILIGIEEGRAVRNLCVEQKVSSRTFYEHLRADPENEKRYARAKEAQADAIFDEILEIADDGSNDWMKREDGENEGYALNGEHVQRSRLRVDSRKWMASKLAPKKYGDRILHGSDPENPLPPADADPNARAKALAAVLLPMLAKGRVE